jgi:hypothetical protein
LDIPPSIGTISQTWIDDGSHPAPGPDPATVTLYGWGYPTILPLRCRETFFNPDSANYTYDAGPMGITIRQTQVAVKSDANPQDNRNAEWTAVVSGSCPRGTFQLQWITPKRGDAGSLPVTITFQKITETVFSSGLYVPIPNGKWVATAFSTSDDAFNSDDLQITSVFNGVRIGFIGAYQFRDDLSPPTEASNSTTDVIFDSYNDQEIGITLNAFISDGMGGYTPYFSPSISVDKGTDCIADLGGTGTQSLVATDTTGSFTFTAAWS